MEPKSEPRRAGLEVATGGATSTQMTIKPLDPEVTRKISTQQVIPGLPEACRELIDNALDAGGKVIEIRTYRGGYTRLEVIDNGEGVKPNDRDKLCKPHCTSKLRSMEELKSLTTFGFRGEALNSLASLGKVTITTRCSSDPRATQMVFDEHGSIITQKLTAGNAGTIVSVESLFDGMPVRRQELLNNIKYEFHKLTRVVQTFAFGHPDVRFRLGDTPEGKPRKEIFTTPGGTQTTLRDVITRVFGSMKEVGELLEMKELLPKDEIALHYKLEKTVGSEVEIYDAIKFSGYVSSCTANGKPAKDRQFFYVNKREVDYPKLSRIANQIYKTWRQDNPPLLILFIELDPADLDVNVTPDKRKLLYKYESQLFAKFHASLLHTLRSAEGAPVAGAVTPSILPVAGAREQSPEREELLPEKRARTEQGDTSSIAYDEEDEDIFEDTASTAYDPGSPTFTERSDTSMFRELDEEYDRPRGASKRVLNRDSAKKKWGAFAGKTGERGANKSSASRLLAPASTRNTSMTGPSIVPASTLPLRQHQVAAVRLGEERTRQSVRPVVMQPAQTTTHSVEDSAEQAERWMRLRELQLQDEHDLNRELKELLRRGEDDDEEEEEEENVPAPRHSEQIDAYQLDDDDDDDEGTDGHSSDDSENGGGGDGDDGDNPLRPCELLEMDFNQLERDFHTLHADSIGGDVVASSATNYVTFSYMEPSQDLLMAQARNSGSTEGGKHCYEEGDEEAVPLDDRGLQQLSTMLKADDFQRMTVVGQFNQSLILVRHANAELFLIDQHAADEKFLFEKYQREKQLEPQKCTNPQPLFLGALNEQLLRDNLPAMEINGFKFEFDESAEVGAQARMTHTPGGEFTIDDVENIISALGDQTAGETMTSDATIYRPAKLRDLLAMEACRNAVMFNHVIDEAKMRSIVDNMGTMNQPWNCPHGRPTIRHIGTIRRETVPMDDAGRIMVQKKEEENDGAADDDGKENLQLAI